MSEFKYKDILNVKYPNPEIEKDFPDAVLRAIQFAPFAALSGHDEAINETARQTEARREPDEYEKDMLNQKLNFIKEHIGEDRCYSITYFVPDSKKQGGRYVTQTAAVSKFKEFERRLILSGGVTILFEDIIDIQDS